jgi:hypothetical protein
MHSIIVFMCICMCTCLSAVNFESVDMIFMKLGVNIMQLEEAQSLDFLILYQQ